MITPVVMNNLMKPGNAQDLDLKNVIQFVTLLSVLNFVDLMILELMLIMVLRSVQKQVKLLVDV